MSTKLAILQFFACFVSPSLQSYVNITQNYRYEAQKGGELIQAVSLIECLTQIFQKQWAFLNFKIDEGLCEIFFLKTEDGKEVKKFGWQMATPIKLKNVALNGLATQSSTFRDGTLMNEMEASTAIDGVITNSVFAMTGCSHTIETLRVWFLLDLLHVYEIERVVVYNRIEGGQYLINQRTSGFTLSIRKEVDGIATNEQPVEMADIKRKEFPVHNYGRYVCIHTASKERKILSICELQVYAYTL